MVQLFPRLSPRLSSLIAPLVAPLAALAVAACASGTGAPPHGAAAAPKVHAPPPLQAMVAVANPLAAEAGLKVLKAGGSAADAAVAIQAMLGLVEPQSSGLGGGGFLNYYDAATRTVTAYNGRETAPSGATPDMFLGPDGKPLGILDAVVSGRATGAPGAVAVLALAQKEHGVLPWGGLFNDVIRTAEEGFSISPRLNRMIGLNMAGAAQPDVKARFAGPDGAPLKTGDT
jgi:gamma-glutamyltranspeptidase / glutathione hydrolase